MKKIFMTVLGLMATVFVFCACLAVFYLIGSWISGMEMLTGIAFDLVLMASTAPAVLVFMGIVMPYWDKVEENQQS